MSRRRVKVVVTFVNIFIADENLSKFRYLGSRKVLPCVAYQ